MIEVKKEGNLIEFYWDNGCHMGHAYLEVDGYYVFVFEGRDGFHSEHELRAIADKLRELNKKWDDKVNEYFSNVNNTEHPQ